jgi:uncharacterized protein (DUF983 family)
VTTESMLVLGLRIGTTMFGIRTGTLVVGLLVRIEKGMKHSLLVKAMMVRPIIIMVSLFVLR